MTQTYRRRDDLWELISIRIRTQKYEIIKSKSIVKENGNFEYTSDDIKTMDDKIGILNDVLNVITVGTIKPID